MPSTFAYDPVRAAAAIETMKTAPLGAVAIPGGTWAQGAMEALVHAELLAAEAGLVPWLTMPDGTRGVLTIGAARERLDNAPEDVRTIYLATHALVRATHATAKPAAGHAPELEGDLGEPISLGIIALTVVAVAAIIGTAWYFTQRSTIEVDGRNLRTTALAADVARIAHAQLATTGKIDPGIWEVFKEIARAENDSPWAAIALTGLVLVGGVGGVLAWKHAQATAPRRLGGAR